MPNLMNRKMLVEYEKQFSSLEAALFLKFEKHDTAQDYELRKQLRKEGATMSVVKNRIARRALASRISEEALAYLKGPTAIVYGDVERAIAASKVIERAQREKAFSGIEVQGGFLQGAVLDAAGAKALATLPGKKELLGMILGAVTAPATNVARLAQEMLVAPARLAAALLEKREKEGSSAA